MDTFVLFQAHKDTIEITQTPACKIGQGHNQAVLMVYNNTNSNFMEILVIASFNEDLF